MDWTELKSKATRVGEPLISIKNGKLVGFNASFMRLNKLTEKKRVKMFHKKDESMIKIGFVFYTGGEEGNKITKNGKSDAAFTSASALFNEYNLNPKEMETTKFTPKKEMSGNEELYYIEVLRNQIS